MSMHYYNRRHQNDKSGSKTVATLSNLSVDTKDEMVEETPKKKGGRPKKDK